MLARARLLPPKGKAMVAQSETVRVGIEPREPAHSTLTKWVLNMVLETPSTYSMAVTGALHASWSPVLEDPSDSLFRY